MKPQPRSDHRCTYVVSLDAAPAPEQLQSLAVYLSSLVVADCAVLVLDGSPNQAFAGNDRVLRWVARHIPVAREQRTAAGLIDPVMTALELASTEKIVIARPDVRYAAEELTKVCELLDSHEVVEPQDYYDALPWWSAIDAGRMLVHRSFDSLPDHGATFGLRRSLLRQLRGAGEERREDPVRRLAADGAQVFSALDLFVRRTPVRLREWFKEETRQAVDDLVLPVKSAFFLTLLPALLLVALMAGPGIAALCLAAVAFATAVLALRGRAGARAYFPLHACLFAPLWVLERSMTVYWALAMRLRRAAVVGERITVPELPGRKTAAGQKSTSR